MRSRVIESSDSESDEKDALPSKHPIQLLQEPSAPCTESKRVLMRQTSSMVVEVESDYEDDGAILVLCVSSTPSFFVIAHFG